MPVLRTPPAKFRPSFRFKDASLLAPTTAFANTGIKYAIVPVFGAASVTVRIKTASAGGTIDLFFVGPDFAPDQTAAYASLVGTIYTTGNATQVAVSAGTEALITIACAGENYVLVKFTGGGTGTITYCDVCQLPVSF